MLGNLVRGVDSPQWGGEERRPKAVNCKYCRGVEIESRRCQQVTVQQDSRTTARSLWLIPMVHFNCSSSWRDSVAIHGCELGPRQSVPWISNRFWSAFGNQVQPELQTSKQQIEVTGLSVAWGRAHEGK